MMLRLACLLCALALAAANTPANLTWAQLKPYTGQWKIDIGLTTTADKSVFVPHNCSSKSEQAACNQPLMQKTQNDRIKVTYSFINATAPFATYQAATPQSVKVFMCYTNVSSAGRPWRSPNPVISKDNSCPQVLGSAPFPAGAPGNATTFKFNVTNSMVTASWFVRVVTICADGTSQGTYCQADDTNSTAANNTANVNFFATQKQSPVDATMIAVASVASAIGPILFFTYFGLDSRRRKVAATS